jgi:hypothetical protein
MPGRSSVCPAGLSATGPCWAAITEIWRPGSLPMPSGAASFSICRWVAELTGLLDLASCLRECGLAPWIFLNAAQRPADEVNLQAGQSVFLLSK